MEDSYVKSVMVDAVMEALKTMLSGKGGPFGAALVNKETYVVEEVSSNLVLETHDPTAHAEITAIRNLTKKLGTHDLSNYVLVTTCYPCPMCMGAIIWANIDTVYYGSTAEDARDIGFRDDHIYEFIKGGCTDSNLVKIEQVGRSLTIDLFVEYDKLNGEIY